MDIINDTRKADPMITINEELGLSLPPVTEDTFPDPVDPESLLALDIETTGLTAGDNGIYLIGCAYLEQGRFMLRQWFAETEDAEREILAAFRSFAGTYHTLLHYNGTRFDIPFLQERFTRYGIADPFEPMASIDLYRYAQPLKNVFGLPDLKQRTVERFLGRERTDTHSGRELIEVYRAYGRERQDSQKEALLLHNADDIRGLLCCLPLLSYQKLTGHLDGLRVLKAQAKGYDDIHGNRKWELYLELELPIQLPAPISLNRDGCFLRADAQNATLRIPLHDCEMKYFYAGWRDYFYLPEEDTALHKSVAEYVDKAYRIKATPATCYTRKKSQYLQQWDALFEPYFRPSYEDTNLYFELTDERKRSREDLARYAEHVISHIIQ